MKKHLQPESLSAYLDGELDGRERSEVEEHLGACADCSAVRTRLAATMGSVAGLGPVTVSADEHRTLRQTILSSRPAASTSRRFGFPQWALAGGLVLVAFTALAFSLFRPEGRGASDEALTEAAAPASGGAGFNFESGDQVDRTVAALPEVTAGMNRYRAGDTDRRDAEEKRVKVFTGPGESPGSTSPGAPQAMARSETAADSAGNAVPGVPAPAAESPGTAGEGSASSQNSAPSLFTNQAADECLGRVSGTQSYPMVPLLAREASFEGRPAWLLVFAWSPDASGDEPLDRWQSWLVDPVDCRDFTGAELAAKALYRSYSPAPKPHLSLGFLTFLQRSP